MLRDDFGQNWNIYYEAFVYYIDVLHQFKKKRERERKREQLRLKKIEEKRRYKDQKIEKIQYNKVFHR